MFLQKTNLPVLSKKKFLVPATMTLAQFCSVLKGQIKEELEAAGENDRSSPYKTIYFQLRNRKTPVMTKNMSEIYDKEKDEDGFLYLHFSEESVFG